MTTALIIYAVGIVVVLAAAARHNTVDVRSACVGALLWPALLLFVVLVLPFERRGWNFDIGRPPEHLKNWGVRKAEAWPRSWAARCPWLELRVWCTR